MIGGFFEVGIAFNLAQITAECLPPGRFFGATTRLGGHHLPGDNERDAGHPQADERADDGAGGLGCQCEAHDCPTNGQDNEENPDAGVGAADGCGAFGEEALADGLLVEVAFDFWNRGVELVSQIVERPFLTFPKHPLEDGLLEGPQVGPGLLGAAEGEFGASAEAEKATLFGLFHFEVAAACQVDDRSDDVLGIGALVDEGAGDGRRDVGWGLGQIVGGEADVRVTAAQIPDKEDANHSTDKDEHAEDAEQQIGGFGALLAGLPRGGGGGDQAGPKRNADLHLLSGRNGPEGDKSDGVFLNCDVGLSEIGDHVTEVG